MVSMHYHIQWHAIVRSGHPYLERFHIVARSSRCRIHPFENEVIPSFSVRLRLVCISAKMPFSLQIRSTRAARALPRTANLRCSEASNASLIWFFLSCHDSSTSLAYRDSNRSGRDRENNPGFLRSVAGRARQRIGVPGQLAAVLSSHFTPLVL